MTEPPVELLPESPMTAIYGPNPLLTALGPRIGFQDWPAKLTQRPLGGFDTAGLSATAREEMLVLYRQHFIATTAGINIAAALQNIHREHYWQRHPCNPSVAKTKVQIAHLLRSTNLAPTSIPWLNTSASGLIIKGITGTGKTSITTRYTDLLGEQVREHFDGTIPGFDYVKQIVWLKVDMSSDGSRDGFLTSILLEVDRLIGTNYARQYSGRYSVDKLAIVIGVILSTHLCGMLIIEEIQEKNFNNSKWHNPLTTFFLRILNFGIPTVLIGNPLGFTELEKSSQNVRRLSSGGIFEMVPTLDETGVEFQNFIEQSWLFNVMIRQSDRGRDHFRKVAYRYSGGVTDFVVRLNVESQLLALRLGAEEVLPEHIDAAYLNSPRIVPNHSLIEGLVQRDRNKLNLCDDIPVEYFANLWFKDQQDRNIIPDSTTIPPENQASARLETSRTTDGADTTSSKKSTSSSASPTKRKRSEPNSKQPKEHSLLKSFKSEKTRKTNVRSKAFDLKGRLSTKDIRGDEGRTESLVSALSDLLKDDS